MAAWAGARSGPRAVPPLSALTLLYHPDFRRIGERAELGELLRGGAVEISRNTPELAPPGRMAGAPIEDRHVSRSPFRLLATGDGGVEFRRDGSRTSVWIDGEPLRDEILLPAEAVDRGVVLELSERVVLLLHRLPPGPAELPPRYGLIGESSALIAARADIQRVAGLEVPVLVRGETGTGKELVARAIHDASARRSGPFFAVNLGAIPASLAATELFGAIRGAYTGSVASQEGYFRRAHHGTLFLDEIGEAPPEVQVMLLRALEAGEIYPVGAQAAQKVDVRVLAATDADLEGQASRGGFRAPLLHRLAGYEIWLPPLRQRRDDLGRLLIHFLREELQAIGEGRRLDPTAPGFDAAWLPAGLVARLALFDWPGNVRQLRNVVRQLVIGSRGLGVLALGDRVERLLRERGPAEPGGSPGLSGSSASMPALGDAAPAGRRWRHPSEVTEDELSEALRANRWDLKAAAMQLHVSRTSLYALIEESSRFRHASDLLAEEIERCHRECGGDLDAMAERLEVSRRALGRRVREMGLD
jgi:DNA-binding NtrC family response regulator